jgi:hypothetical protein
MKIEKKAERTKEKAERAVSSSLQLYFHPRCMDKNTKQEKTWANREEERENARKRLGKSNNLARCRELSIEVNESTSNELQRFNID